MSKDDPKELFNRREDFLEVFRKGAEFTEELLRENERLRMKILSLEEKLGGTTPTPEASGSKLIDELMSRIRSLEEERDRLLMRFQEVEAENKDFANRYVEIEEENNNLANLYVASYQLHSTLDFKEVLQIITEIIVNLIGAEEFAMYLTDEKHREMVPVQAEGIERERLQHVALGTGILGRVGETGDNYFAEEALHQPPNPERPVVCIPLKIKSKVIGLIAIYKFLQQKTKLASVDYELFTLLAGHAATAIFSAKLYSDSERKLNTIQGFINLMTSR